MDRLYRLGKSTANEGNGCLGNSINACSLYVTCYCYLSDSVHRSNKIRLVVSDMSILRDRSYASTKIWLDVSRDTSRKISRIKGGGSSSIACVARICQYLSSSRNDSGVAKLNYAPCIRWSILLFLHLVTYPSIKLALTIHGCCATRTTSSPTCCQGWMNTSLDNHLGCLGVKVLVDNRVSWYWPIRAVAHTHTCIICSSLLRVLDDDEGPVGVLGEGDW